MLRLTKSLSEKIYLLSANQISTSEWGFKVRGQSKNIYEQFLTKDKFSCSCPDHKTKSTFCKHLLFLVARVAIQMEIASSLSNDKTLWMSNPNYFNACSKSWINRLKSRISDKKPKPVDLTAIGNDCPVCFEEMKEGESLVKCITTCKNHFHKECINLWISSGHNNCPLCRAAWVKDEIENEEDIDIEVKLLAPPPPPAPIIVPPAPTIVPPTPTIKPKKAKSKKIPAAAEPTLETITEITPEPTTPEPPKKTRGRKKKETGLESITEMIELYTETMAPTTPTTSTTKRGHKKKDTLVSVEPVAAAAPVVSVEPVEPVVPVVEEVVEMDDIITDLVFSFDTTGSMYPCLTEVRRNIKNISEKLFKEIPNLRLAIIAHGDYCDGDDKIKILDFTSDVNMIKQFIHDAPATGGGDYPECYELVLQESRKLSWRMEAKMKSLIMIGDAPPHEKNENPTKIDWLEETEKLRNRNIQVFSVQCLNSGCREAFQFYSTISRMTNGYHLFLDQFSYIKDMIQAICFRQYNNAQLQNFESEVQKRDGGMNNALRLMFDTMLGRKTREQVEDEMRPERYLSRYTSRRSSSEPRAPRTTSMDESELRPCLPTRFQSFTVDEDCGIKEFCSKMGIEFHTGCGFYEFIKAETISYKKEIVLMEKETGNLYEGDVARNIARLTDSTDRKIKPTDLDKYNVFVQSTSSNRKLLKNQKFLYEVST